MLLLRKIIFWVVFLLIVWIAASLIALNKDVVTVDALFGKFELKLGFALLTAFVFGLALGMLSMFLAWLKSLNRNRIIKKEKNALDKEVQNMRTLPMSDSSQG